MRSRLETTLTGCGPTTPLDRGSCRCTIRVNRNSHRLFGSPNSFSCFPPKVFLSACSVERLPLTLSLTVLDQRLPPRSLPGSRANALRTSRPGLAASLDCLSEFSRMQRSFREASAPGRGHQTTHHPTVNAKMASCQQSANFARPGATSRGSSSEAQGSQPLSSATPQAAQRSKSQTSYSALYTSPS